jgi:hypothetical protein
MKDEKWLVYLIVFFTSITTVLLLADGTLIGFIRGVAAAVLLDGLIAYWDDKRIKLKSQTQRKWAEGMMWAGVGIMFIFAAGYGIEYFAPVDAVKPVDLFGYKFTMTLTDLILMLAASFIGMWIVSTLGVILYMRRIDPEVSKDLELTKALEERDREEMTAYKEALKVTARQIGTEKAVKLFRKNLENEGYTPAQIATMEQEARLAIASAHGAIPVDSNMRAYQSTVTNPTNPSTPQN